MHWLHRELVILPDIQQLLSATLALRILNLLKQVLRGQVNRFILIRLELLLNHLEIVHVSFFSNFLLKIMVEAKVINRGRLLALHYFSLRVRVGFFLLLIFGCLLVIVGLLESRFHIRLEQLVELFFCE